MPGVGAIRALASARVDAFGLGRIARDIGMPKSGLKYFLEGASPRRPTLRKLEDWYVLAAGSGAAGVHAEAAALSLLLRDVPEPLRLEARRRAISLWCEFFDDAHLLRPPWLTQLLEST